MSTTPINPAEIAREAFRQLAVRRIAPTPDAYRDIYNQIAGIVPAAVEEAVAEGPNADSVLSDFASRLSENTGELAEFGRRFTRAIKTRDWEGYARGLSQLAERQLRKP